ncbi:hypothetical protein [Enterococcus sp. 5H]|uniref:hypothetical protein n=1 Tax=Enterococcus sp. 5H TaxID=1229490 RepID=UPI002302C4CB|nr:hypothetical protein [Enterococcus sp. 5H]MDA9472836.1 hypothetical protein [Enterococcus sp. 5H]
MSVLETLFILGIAGGILSSLGALLFLFQYYSQRKKIKNLPREKGKNHRKNRKISKQKKELYAKKKKKLSLVILFIILVLLLSSSSAYIAYYQAMSLSTDDSNSVVKGYYLLRDFEDQLILAKGQEEEEEKIQQNIRYLSTAMASYGTKKASNLNTQEGQLSLNRYYNAIKQLGMNASTQTKNFYGNSNLVEEFLVDIARAHEYERVAFDYYKVNDNAFSEK